MNLPVRGSIRPYLGALHMLQAVLLAQFTFPQLERKKTEKKKDNLKEILKKEKKKKANFNNYSHNFQQSSIELYQINC